MSSTVQFAVACFLLFFALSQFFQWASELTLPLPIFILGGAFLAIASNFDRRAGLPFNFITPPDEDESPIIAPSTQDPVSPPATPPRSVSFTIRKPEK